MHLFAQQPTPAAVILSMAIEGLFLFGSLYAWTYLCSRYFSGKPVLPAYQPRQFTPWTGWDLLVILSFNLLVIFTLPLGIFCTEKATGLQII